MKENCTNNKLFINAKDELVIKCHKHYCLCNDEFIWDSELNKKYQIAKKEDEANNGIFSKK